MIGTVLSSKAYGDYTVVEKLKGKMLVRFTDTGYEKLCDIKEVKSGAIKDLMKPSVYGVGFIGEGSHSSRDASGSKTCYIRWLHMLGRCYNKEDINYALYGGRGVSVADEWRNYQNYAKWYYNQPCVDGVKYVVDKDIIGEGLLYSSSTCILVPQDLNKTLNLSSRYTGNIKGVSFSKHKGKFVAECTYWGANRPKHLGYFHTREEARDEYMKVKEEYIKSAANYYLRNKLISEQTYDALMKLDVRERFDQNIGRLTK